MGKKENGLLKNPRPEFSSRRGREGEENSAKIIDGMSDKKKKVQGSPVFRHSVAFSSVLYRLPFRLLVVSKSFF